MSFPPDRAAALAPPLTTPRLRLLPRLGAHAEVFFPALSAPALSTWIDTLRPESAEALRSRWAARENRLSPEGTQAWLAWTLWDGRDHAPVGWVDATVEPVPPPLRTPDGLPTLGTATAPLQVTNFGYLLLTDHWGRGLATEASAAVLAHFDTVGVVSVRATVTVGNVASARVLDKLGFSRTGVLRENDTLRGVLVDDWIYDRERPWHPF